MAKIFLDANESFRLLDDTTIFGSGFGSESVIIMGQPRVEMDANIERVELTGSLDNYTFQISGTSVTIFSSGNTVGSFSSLNNDVTLAFAEGSAILSLTALNAATLGGQAISISQGGAAVTSPVINSSDVSSVADYVPDNSGQEPGNYTVVSADLGSVDNMQILDANSGKIKFTDNPDVQNYVQISNFSSDDLIEITKTPGQAYSFSNDGADVNIISNNNGTINHINLVGVVDAADIIYDETSFETAIGFNAFTIA